MQNSWFSYSYTFKMVISGKLCNLTSVWCKHWGSLSWAALVWNSQNKHDLTVSDDSWVALNLQMAIHWGQEPFSIFTQTQLEVYFSAFGLYAVFIWLTLFVIILEMMWRDKLWAFWGKEVGFGGMGGARGALAVHLDRNPPQMEHPVHLSTSAEPPL